MVTKLCWSVVVLLIFVCLSGRASAVPISPTFDLFGELTGATFGGSGIPDDPVAITTIVDGGNTITLGLGSHGRFSNPIPPDDGAGTFSPTVGSNFGDPSMPLGPGPSATIGSTWNVNYYMDIVGGGSFADYTFELVYDFDPGVGTDQTDHGVLDINGALIFNSLDPATFTLLESSQNLQFSFFATGALPFITVPTPGTFDPDVAGEYTVALIVSDGGGELGRSAVLFDVQAAANDAVPEPSSLTLILLAIFGVRVARRRRNHS